MAGLRVLPAGKNDIKDINDTVQRKNMEDCLYANNSQIYGRNYVRSQINMKNTGIKFIKRGGRSVGNRLMQNKLIKRCLKSVHRNGEILKFIIKGYSPSEARSWQRLRRQDRLRAEILMPAEAKRSLAKAHRQGLLMTGFNKSHFLANTAEHFITDLEYLQIARLNTGFSKWLNDQVTANKLFGVSMGTVLRPYYFSIIRRDGVNLIFQPGVNDRAHHLQDVWELLKSTRALDLVPAFWNSKASKYRLKYVNDQLYINNRRRKPADLLRILAQLKADYVVLPGLDYRFRDFVVWKNASESMPADSDFKAFLQDLTADEPAGIRENLHYYIKVYVANDAEQPLLGIYLHLYQNTNRINVRKQLVFGVNLENGQLIKEAANQSLEALNYCLKDFANLKTKLMAVAANLHPINYFSFNIVLKPTADGGLDFNIINFNSNPKLPEIRMTRLLNNYLLGKLELKKSQKPSLKMRLIVLRRFLVNKIVLQIGRKGVRSYMQKLWLRSLWSDFRAKDYPLHRKIWAWRRGFFSWRLHQYGLTAENYQQFLSDYDYHWLNRINNAYQIWINDKTTYRYLMEPYKAYIPDYYFSIYKRNKQVKFAKMQDLQGSYSNDIDGLWQLLVDRKKLALKPSAGTHGDGFYCLIYDQNQVLVNDVPHDKAQLAALIAGFKSYYVVTSFIKMNQELQKIYPKSVNSIRMMVINRNGFEPRLLQAYMRIGSSKTGYTDNVGYGGICVNVDVATGRLYQPERIVNHFFESCPVHPDTNTEIAGILPNWPIVCEQVLKIASYMPELEYLGFDVAITDGAFEIMEINIHQDLHKVADHTPEIRQYYQDKIKYKKQQYAKPASK